jgi:hypothetical protein
MSNIRVIRPFMKRRTLLRGMLGGMSVAIGLPLLEAMVNDSGTKLASGAELPKRFGVFYWGGGIVHETWVPAATGKGWALPDAIQPFSNLADYVTMVTGTKHAGSSPPHIPARGIALSSSHDMTICQGDCVGTYRGQNHPQPSIDNIVADAWDGSTAFRSLEVSISQKGPYKNNSSWKAGGTTYNRHEPSPQAVFDRLFGTPVQTEEPGLLEAMTSLERSMLDAVIEDARSLSLELGSVDRQRIEQHLEGLRAIEQRLQGVSTVGCTQPDAPEVANFGDGSDNEQKQAKSEIMSELVATALACDLVRVFSYEWSATQSDAVYWEVGSSQEHHELTHTQATGTHAKAITKLIMQNYAYLAEQLRDKSMPDGSNLLDHTLVLGTSEHANAGAHNYSDHPFLLVGKAGGAIDAGMHHRTSGSGFEAPKVLLTAVRAVGVEVAQIGDPNSGSQRVATTTISEIEG